MVDHFDTGPDCGPDHKNKGLKINWFGPIKWTNLQLDQTTDWTTRYSKFPGKIKNKDLKMDRSGPLKWTNLQTGQEDNQY